MPVGSNPDIDRSGTSGRRHGPLAPLLLALVATIPCWPVLFLGQAFYFRDIYLYYLPQKALAASMLREGILPLWDPFFHAGSALWANPDNMVAHPTTLFFMLAPATLAYGLATAAWLMLAALGAFGLARRLGLSREAAFMAGASFALSGVMASLVNFHATFLALCPLPALLWAWDAWIAEGRRRTLAAVTLFAALIGLSSGVEAALAGAMLMLLWTLVARRAEPGAASLARRVAALAICGVLALALSSPAWLPAMEVLRGSTRGTGYSWNVASLWAVDPARLPELIVPGFLGEIRGLFEAGYWGRGLENGFTPYYVSLTLGPILVALILVGMSRSAPMPTALRRMLAALFIGSIALAVAPRLPGIASLASAAGFESPLRFPVKFVLLGALPSALLAAAGFDATLRRASEDRRWPVAATILVAMAVVLGLIALWLRLAPESAAEATKAYFRVARAPILARLSQSFLASAALAALGVATLWLAARPGRARLARVMLVVIVVLGLLDSAVRVNPTTPREMIETEPPLVALVRERVGEGRLYRAEDESLPMQLAAPTDDAVHLARFNLDTLRYYLATRHGIPVAFHVDPDGLAPSRIAEISWQMQRLPWPQRLPLLRSAGVRLVVTNEALAVDGLVPREVLDLGGGAPTRLYEVTNSAPTLRFLPRARFVPDEAAARDEMKDPAIDPRTEVILVGPASSAPTSDCAGSVVPSDLALASEQDAVIDAGCDGFVVMALPFQPGLAVEIDGEPQPLLVADAVFCAVKVSAGHHALRWSYRSRRLPIALGLAAIAALATAGLALVRDPRAS